jgi:lipopolysaccharide assembly protein A
LKTFAWLLRTVLFVLLLVFALQNQHVVELHGILGARWSAPLIWILCATLLLGALAGALAMLPRLWRARAAGKAATKASTASATTTKPAVTALTHRDDELGV